MLERKEAPWVRRERKRERERERVCGATHPPSAWKVDLDWHFERWSSRENVIPFRSLCLVATHSYKNTSLHRNLQISTFRESSSYLSLSLSLSLCRFHVFARIDDTRDAFGMIARSFFSAFLSAGVLARDGPFACVARHGRACLAAEGMCCADFLFARERKEETGRHRDATSILLVRMDRLWKEWIR